MPNNRIEDARSEGLHRYGARAWPYRPLTLEAEYALLSGALTTPRCMAHAEAGAPAQPGGCSSLRLSLICVSLSSAPDTLESLSDSELKSFANTAVATLLGCSILIQAERRVPVGCHGTLDSATLSSLIPRAS